MAEMTPEYMLKEQRLEALAAAVRRAVNAGATFDEVELAVDAGYDGDPDGQ
jgi:hypothetical protein